MVVLWSRQIILLIGIRLKSSKASSSIHAVCRSLPLTFLPLIVLSDISCAISCILAIELFLWKACHNNGLTLSSSDIFLSCLHTSRSLTQSVTSNLYIFLYHHTLEASICSLPFSPQSMMPIYRQSHFAQKIKIIILMFY